MRGKAGVKSEKQLGLLILLFSIFLISAYQFEKRGQEFASVAAPTSFNVKSNGVRALSLLLQSQGFSAAPLETNWDALSSDTGLLVMIEPFTRNVEVGEISSLNHWVKQGGSVLYLVTGPARPADPADTVFGAVAVIPGDNKISDIPIKSSASPYFNQVHMLQIKSDVRLAPAATAGYSIDAKDRGGVQIMHKTFGKGQLIVAAAASLATNEGIQKVDNALFLVNIASIASGKNQKILFDEYHHDIGFKREGQAAGILNAAPKPLRWAFWQFAIWMCLLVYNGNKRFGKPQITSSPEFRPSSEYVQAMSRFIRRARAADVALLPIYSQFVRDIEKACHLTHDVPKTRLVEESARHTGFDPAQLSAILTRCEEVEAGVRISETELMTLCRSMEAIQRRL